MFSERSEPSQSVAEVPFSVNRLSGVVSTRGVPWNGSESSETPLPPLSLHV